MNLLLSVHVKLGTTRVGRTRARFQSVPAFPRMHPSRCTCVFLVSSSDAFKVGFAVEFEVMSDDSDRSDMFGHAISLDGSLLLAGASKKHRDVPEIQLIVSTGSSAEVNDLLGAFIYRHAGDDNFEGYGNSRRKHHIKLFVWRMRTCRVLKSRTASEETK